jgi:clan AA aspartic protease
MIVGRVRKREPRISLTIRGSGGQALEIECVVDTGHTGWLTLPPQLITQLDLPWHSFGQGTLADGSVVFYDVYLAKILWHGRVRRVRVSELAAAPLVGMSLLGRQEKGQEKGSAYFLVAVPGGSVHNDAHGSYPASCSGRLLLPRSQPRERPPHRLSQGW